MKTESNVKYILRLAGILLLITSVVALVLAGVNTVTAPIIAQQKEAKTQAAIEAVLPGGFDEELPDNDPTDIVTKIYRGANGHAFEVTPSGFDNTITMMVGVDFEGNVLGISIVSHTETAGLGAVAAATTSAGETFREQFKGVSGSAVVTKDGGQINAITGATITSRAVCEGVNAALACAATLG